MHLVILMSIEFVEWLASSCRFFRADRWKLTMLPSLSTLLTAAAFPKAASSEQPTSMSMAAYHLLTTHCTLLRSLIDKFHNKPKPIDSYLVPNQINTYAYSSLRSRGVAESEASRLARCLLTNSPFLTSILQTYTNHWVPKLFCTWT